MTTIEERHKIAERLRMRLANWSGMGWRIHIPEIGNGVWMENHGGNDELEEAAKRLADLIDPTCLARADVEDTPDGGQFECWSCSVCGNIVSVDPDYDTETDGPAYCEMCGHRIIGKGEPTWL